MNGSAFTGCPTFGFSLFNFDFLKKQRPRFLGAFVRTFGFFGDVWVFQDLDILPFGFLGYWIWIGFLDIGVVFLIQTYSGKTGLASEMRPAVELGR